MKCLPKCPSVVKLLWSHCGKAGLVWRESWGVRDFSLLWTVTLCWCELTFGQLHLHRPSSTIRVFICLQAWERMVLHTKICRFFILATSTFGLEKQIIIYWARIVFVFWQYVKIEPLQRDTTGPCLRSNIDSKKMKKLLSSCYKRL